MKTALTTLTALLLIVFAGCEPKAEKKELATHPGKAPTLTGEKTLFTVDFQQDQTLRYRFVSSRNIELNWDPDSTKSRTKRGRNQIDKSYESLSMVVAYSPVEVNPYGLTTIKATCESAKARSTGRRSRGKDAVENFKGKSFTFTINPAGKIENYSQLEKLIKEVGKTAFRQNSKGGRIKEPDMIGDFIATQWFLWNSISSIKKPVEGVRIGQSWTSELSIPTPMVTKKARNVTYSLDEIRQTEKGRLAVIKSSYSLADSTPDDWPLPYSGSFQMSGTFGFLRGYRFLDLQGEGEELFNIDAGRIEQYHQRYEVKVKASFPMGLGTNPVITIKQNLKMELIE